MAHPTYDIDFKRQIYFIVKQGLHYKSSNLTVKISLNFKKIILAYGKDTY